jgi:hypothetical protein
MLTQKQLTPEEAEFFQKAFLTDQIANKISDRIILNIQKDMFIAGGIIGAVLISFLNFHSIVWAFIAGLFSWLYIVYYIVAYCL